MARTGLTPSAATVPATPLSSGRQRGELLLRVKAWIVSPAVREPVGIFLLTRFLFLLLTFFGVILFTTVLHGPHPSRLHQLVPAWYSPGWDTEWYVDIARRGYAWKKAAGTSPTAFFPLYPLLIRLGVLVTHRSYGVVALGLSNLSFLAALLYLWRLTAWEIGSRAAGRTILYTATFPTALFFFAGYTESLFLFLTVASFFHLRRRDWLLAGIFGALASATRVTGVLLFLPLAYEYARSCNFSWRRLDPGVVSLALVPAGLLAFMLYLHWAVGDALAFSHSQHAWQKIFTLRLWAGFLESLRQIIIVQPPASFYQAHNIINAGVGALFLLWTAFASRRLPPPYALYLVSFWLMTLSSPAMYAGYPVPLVSLARYVLSLFPIFMYMGTLGRRRAFHDVYLVLSVSMLALLTLVFVTGRWIV
jgi:hypothetical protein